jgi:serine/threonine-protein kinase
MRPERWKHVEDLYHKAAARTAADRSTFLADACGGDEALRQELESLLAQDVPAGSFLDEPALAVAARQVAGEMPLLTGRSLGPYLIGELLGAGGMGDVYRAQDTVLGRDVAIKILSAAVEAAPARLAQFEQEARVLASFSHPHIGAIYGVQVAEHIRGLVLELVDGETLADRIRRGRIPLGEAIRIAREIAEALDAAHQRGIVHRDLKPANIKITADGVTKVLDFGLAQAAPIDTGGVSEASSVDGPSTLIRGTAAYMSPEQARGAIVDKRTDIWAFGCVVYEMLTGHAAFSGDTTSATVAAVVERAPDWALLAAVAPANLCLLVRRCLDKDPKRRRRDIGDVQVDLDEAMGANAAPTQRSRRVSGSVFAGGLLLLLTASALLMWTTRWFYEQQAPPGPLSFASLLLPHGTDFPDQDNQIAVSPDGTMIAYVGALAGQPPRLILRKLDTTLEPLIDALDVRDPFFSPDGGSIGFIAGDTIRVVSLADGQSRVVCRAPRAESPSWGDDVIVFGESGDLPSAGIRRVAAKGGASEVVSTPDRGAGETAHQAPQVLPDGRSIMYTIRARTPSGTIDRLVVQTPGNPVRVLLDDAGFGRYIGNSVLIYQRDRSLFATTLDLGTMTTSGPGMMLFNDLSPSTRPLWAAAGGVLVYRPRNENRRFVWVGRDGTEIPLPGQPGPYAAPSLSPRGDRIAVDIAGEGNRFDVWMFDIEQQRLRPLTSDGASRYPHWTPDGAHVGVDQRAENRLYWVNPDGNEQRELIRRPLPVWIGSWTRDTATLVYMEENPATKSDLWTIDLHSKARPRPVIQSPAREYGGRLSPDGRWLAYFSDESGRFELYLAAFPAGAPRKQISTRVDTAQPREAVWAKDGRELFYRQGSQMLSVRIPADPSLQVGRPTVLFGGNYYAWGGPGIVNYDVSQDGQRFLMLKPVEDPAPHVNLVLGLGRLIRERLQPAGR